MGDADLLRDTCSEPRCDSPVRYRGLCGKHYDRGIRTGTLPRLPPAPPPEERFWRRVDFLAPRGCWLWLGPTDKRGYGRLTRRLYGESLAHRFAYSNTVGSIPGGLPLDHLCRVPACVNPAHLEPVTPAENNRRSLSPSARCARQTHCKRGHEFTPENTRIRPNGHRECRTCDQVLGAIRTERKRLARQAARQASWEAAS